MCIRDSGGRAPTNEIIPGRGGISVNSPGTALAAGWGASWLSGWPAYDADLLAEALGLAPGEWIAGFVHIGTCEGLPPERPRPDVPALIEWRDA